MRFIPGVREGPGKRQSISQPTYLVPSSDESALWCDLNPTSEYLLITATPRGEIWDRSCTMSLNAFASLSFPLRLLQQGHCHIACISRKEA